MATKRGGRSDEHSPMPPPRLSLPLARAQAALEERLHLGAALADRVISNEPQYTAWSGEISTWHEYNQSWIEQYIGAKIRAEYAHQGPRIYVASTWPQWAEDRRGDLQTHMRRLKSVHDRLGLWVDDAIERGADQEVDLNGPIFVVHGRDEAVLNTAVRLLEKTTDRTVIVLREQPNSGRTVIEKFEEHAASAAFAVVLVTGDDVGGPKGSGISELQGRARQNVVFELGFFFGKLGRSRVAVLLEEGVEKPSDIDGLVYNGIDLGGAWKTALIKELEAAGVAVDYSRIP